MSKEKGYCKTADLPALPDKRYFSIGETAELCGVKPHVLRYWEQEFEELSPTKRRGNRRYYLQQDILLIRQIRELLYEQGFTILGAKAKVGQKQKSLFTRHQVVQDMIADLEGLLEDMEETA